MDFRLSFNENEVNYDKIRPRYPEEVFDDILTYNRSLSR